MENRIYISVLTSPATTGSIDFTFTTYDAAYGSANITLIASVTGISSTVSEKANSANIVTQLQTIIAQNGADYKGAMSSVTAGPSPTFRLTRTDHCICVYSECQFSIEVSNSTGAIILVRENPVFVTICDARKSGLALGQPWLDLDTGLDLSDLDIAEFLAQASAELISEIRNPIILSTYSYELTTTGTDSIVLPHRPVSFIDSPYIRRPDIMSFITAALSPDPLNLYSVISHQGFLDYRFVQNMLMAFEPFDEGNGVRISYVAGEKQIPEIIKAAVMKLTTIVDADYGGEEVQGGTFRIKVSPILLQRQRYIASTRRYFR